MYIFGYVLMNIEKYTRLLALIIVQGSGEKENKTNKKEEIIME